ncbi:MAG: hypothetical protein FWE98_06965 [Oscillospiraceae bacterium]|nr:hypothetical protein [Oscillospiraceae bacterium]
MKTLYLIAKVLTLPGAFLQGFWEHVTCRILKLEVTDRRYLRPDASCGHAAHAPAMCHVRAYLFSLMPYVAQRILGWIFVAAAAPPLLLFNLRGMEENPLLVPEIIALFLGLSILCNSFPAWEDALRHWRLFYGGNSPEEEQAIEAYTEALLAAFEAVPAPEEGGAPAAPILPEAPGLPKFAPPAWKIILAPCNAYFLAGAWLEKNGIPAIAAVVITVVLLVLR